SLRCGQCLLGSLADGLSLVLSHYSHNAYGHCVCFRHVGRNVFNATRDEAIPQRQQEGSIAAQPVELSHQQRRTGYSASLDGLGKLGAVIALAALNLNELGRDDLPVAAGDELADRLALCFQAKATSTLPRR